MDKYLGVELGSTRIKGVVIDENVKVISSNEFLWENKKAGGLWTYDLEDVQSGARSTVAKLDLSGLKAMGVSAMMHGYLAFGQDGQLLTPFRTWRNENTQKAAKILSDLFVFNIPLRWSVAHLYQAILDGEESVKDVAFLTTLAGYVHWKLTGEKCLGIGDASGMFPVKNGQWNPGHVEAFFKLTGIDWPKIAPAIKLAGQGAGRLTQFGLEYLNLPQSFLGLPLCPPEGDAGTGMVATDSLATRSGNVSAGTSIFAMVVLEGPLLKPHPTVDVVMTPDGHDVAMVHYNECSSLVDGWINLFNEVLELFGTKVPKDKLFTTLYEIALEKGPGALPTFMKQRLEKAVSALKEGLKILTEEEGVSVDFLTGHGGFFKSGQAGQSVMGETVGIPIRLMAHSSEGGAWGMAVLAAYMAAKTPTQKEPTERADRIDRIDQIERTERTEPIERAAELTLVDYVHSIFSDGGKK
ncbi:MAG: ATPase [Deltaproteobacteria bacterium]|jgi:sugar (pentulose or hexulose) kinase|nr:ATPase [Deltaproteobacteria bacterium]